MRHTHIYDAIGGQSAWRKVTVRQEHRVSHSQNRTHTVVKRSFTTVQNRWMETSRVRGLRHFTIKRRRRKSKCCQSLTPTSWLQHHFYFPETAARRRCLFTSSIHWKILLLLPFTNLYLYVWMCQFSKCTYHKRFSFLSSRACMYCRGKPGRKRLITSGDANNLLDKRTANKVGGWLGIQIEMYSLPSSFLLWVLRATVRDEFVTKNVEN